MKDNLPPLPPYAHEFKPRWATDPGGYNEDQMKAYARAAIERQSVPAGSLSLDAALGYIERHTPHLVYSEIKAALAAAPQPQPVRCTYCDGTGDVHSITGEWRGSCGCEAGKAQPQPVQPQGPMAETVEEAARDVAKCLNERDGQGLDLRHVAMLVNHAQQPVQEPVARVRFSDCAFDSVDWIPYQGLPLKDGDLLYTSPQAQPLIEVLTELESMYDKADQSTPLHKGMRMAISTACDRVNAVMKKHGITKGTK